MVLSSLIVAEILVLLSGMASPILLQQSAEPAGQLAAADLQFFEAEVRPILVQHCYECHSGESRILRGGLRLDHRDGVLRGGDSGPAVKIGRAHV